MTALQVYVCVAGRSVCGLFICESEREARVFIRNADVCVTHTHTHTWCMSLSMHEHRMCVYVPREGKKGEREFIRKRNVTLDHVNGHAHTGGRRAGRWRHGWRR
jgi:hypothetical protein